MEVSLKAAKEVNADVLAPELYRRAQETALKARHEYRFKNFEIAKKYADQGRVYAERAEFEALRNGAKRDAVPTDPLAEPSYSPEPYATPDPDAPAPTTGKTTGSVPSVSVPLPKTP